MTGYIALLTVTFEFSAPIVLHVDDIFRHYDLCMLAVQDLAIEHNVKFWQNDMINHNDLPTYTANCKEL